MSLPRETVLELMALADGEVDGEADVERKGRLERLVAESDEARRIVEAMRAPAIGAWLAAEMGARSAAADGIADAVMARLEGDPRSAPVVRLADASPRPTRARGQAFAVAAAGIVALAAGVALYLRSGKEADDLDTPVASVGLPSVDVQRPPAPPAALAQQHPSRGVEVDDVDSPHGISVFEIPLGGGSAAAAHAGGPSSVVIMIQDDPRAR